MADERTERSSTSTARFCLASGPVQYRPPSSVKVNACPLLAPVNPDLAARIWVLLQRGERRIVIDLSGVSRIDAGGVGELVRTFNIASGVNVSLRIVHTTELVREALVRVGLFDLLSADD